MIIFQIIKQANELSTLIFAVMKNLMCFNRLMTFISYLFKQC